MPTERCMCGDTACPICGPLQGFPNPSLAEIENERDEELADIDEDLDEENDE